VNVSGEWINLFVAAVIGAGAVWILTFDRRA
jgi:hypothetical protein